MLEQVPFPDQLSSRYVHQDRIRLHEPKLPRAHEAHGFLRERDGEEDEIALLEQAIEIRERAAPRDGRIRRPATVDPNHAHPEARREAGGLAADPAEPDDPEGLPPNGDAHHVLRETAMVDCVGVDDEVLRCGEEKRAQDVNGGWDGGLRWRGPAGASVRWTDESVDRVWRGHVQGPVRARFDIHNPTSPHL